MKKSYDIPLTWRSGDIKGIKKRVGRTSTSKKNNVPTRHRYHGTFFILSPLQKNIPLGRIIFSFLFYLRWIMKYQFIIQVLHFLHLKKKSFLFADYLKIKSQLILNQYPIHYEYFSKNFHFQRNYFLKTFNFKVSTVK